MSINELPLADYFRFFANEVTSSPLYAALCPILAESEDALRILAGAAPTQQRPNLMFAAMHASLLQDPTHEFAKWHRTCGGDRPADDPSLASVVADFLAQRYDTIEQLVHHGATQTNEPGRSAMLRACLGAIAAERQLPLALLDVGTSAGLNLHLDSYNYSYLTERNTVTLGDESSSVHIACDTSRSSEHLPFAHMQKLDISWRAGLDLNPLDVTDPDQRRWLTALIWPDELERFHRLQAALEHAAARPMTITQGDAVEALLASAASAPDDAHLVITTTWVLTYLTDDARVAFVNEIKRLAVQRPLTWVFSEHPAYAATLPFPPEAVTASGDGVSNGTPVVLVDADRQHFTSRLAGFAHPHSRWLAWSLCIAS
jgi:hypothetical protein